MQRSFRSDWGATGIPTWKATHAKRKDQVNVRLFVSRELRAVAAAVVVVIVTSVSGWPKVLWHRYCILELKLSDSACYLTRWLLPRSPKSL